MDSHLKWLMVYQSQRNERNRKKRKKKNMTRVSAQLPQKRLDKQTFSQGKKKEKRKSSITSEETFRLTVECRTNHP